MAKPSTRRSAGQPVAQPQVLLNGTLLPRDQARVGVTDRGFRFGDGAFESIRVAGGSAYSLDRHLARLAASLGQLRIAAPAESELAAAVAATIAANEVVDGVARIFVTRGEDPDGRGFLPGPISGPSVLVEATALPTGTADAPPLRLWLSSHRRADPRALPSGGKLMCALTSSLARIEADGHDCEDALLLGPHAEVCETSSANLMWVTDGVLYTPDTALPIVAGTIRERVLEVTHLPVRVGTYALSDVQAAQEVFITNVVWLARSVGSLASEIAGASGRWTATTHTDRLRTVLEEDLAAHAAARQAAVG